MSVYVCSDFHGFKSLYDQICDFIKPEDHVYFLGDAADRGPYGWECIKNILDNPQWTYILGNHDFFFISSIFGPYMQDHSMEHYHNGGKYTLDAFKADDVDSRRDYLQRLKNCKYDAVYTNKNGKVCYMSHSGAYFNDMVNVSYEDFVWDRSHLGCDVEKDSGIDYIFHGHTIIKTLCKRIKQISKFYDEGTIEVPVDKGPGKACWYAHHTKCDLDNGTISSGSCVLVDLDTFEEYAFFVSKEEEEFLWL